MLAFILAVGFTVGPLGRPAHARASAAAMSAPSDLDARYAAIASAQPQQQAAYAEWIASGAVDGPALVAEGAALGIEVDMAGGQIAYAADFDAKRLPLCFDLVYCRHGKTTGNTEPRVYQGYVDEPSNALNEIGIGQAEEAADKLDTLDLSPDLVIFSPLSRAADTGTAWVKRHGIEMLAKVERWDETAEMRFGAWDNVMVKDLDDANMCHLFYLAQNALVKPSAPYVAPDGSSYDAENFVEVLTRMHGVLKQINVRMAPLAKGGARPLVLMYGHSMAGAALGVLTGNGKRVDGEAYLGFDGTYIMPNATPVYLHPTPPPAAAGGGGSDAASAAAPAGFEWGATY